MTAAAETRTLVLVRHAEAVSAPPGGDDRERTLTPPGRAAAESFGRWLHERGLGCDEVISSPAARARETVDAVACGGCSEAEVQVEERLYRGDPDDLLDVLRGATSDADVLLVVGHAPTIAAAVSMLADGEGADDAHESLCNGFEPGTAALLRYSGRWSDLAFGAATLEECYRPQPE